MISDPSKSRTGAVDPQAAAQGKDDILARSPFGGLAGSTRQALLELSSLARLPRRHAITEQGQPAESFVLIGSGRVKLERARGDRLVPLGHRGPGEMIGEAAVAGAAVAAETARVVDDAVALTVPVAGLRRQIAGDANLATAMAGALVDQHRQLEVRLEALLLHGVEARLAAFLLDAARRWAVPHADGEVIAAPFTHADIALLIGSTRETVTLLFGKLRREGLVAFDRRRVLIRDRAALVRRASAS